MKLFHGTASETKPVVTTGLHGEVFDGIFATTNYDAAASHGANVFEYDVANIASSSDLDNDEALEVLKSQTFIEDDEKLEALKDIIIWNDDNYSDDMLDDAGITADDLACRVDADCGGLGWEIQRLRGRIASALGFDAVEMTDEHGRTYLIVK